ncbi:hypothetical protein PL11201_700023 [Planktothrix sp. PCC 11201]|uniref:hypothetical protein n=1 Tax=Planktothrix sp. PCC 11201 TaxID=1729650 RepID=UPI00092324E7|nr:hypothetical protein [Planktothrix sp. PCC 11201]SKB15263.1 hypothetical protein PL11201_700023 [Planktothrix sp. PCC 11201]
MSILTNRLKINFNIDAIKRDFIFIRLEREIKGNWSGARELDYLLGKDFHAFAVMFQYGKYAYAMFKKPVDIYQCLSNIRSNKEFNDNAVMEVIPTVSRDDAEDCICEAWLAQILLNSLSSSRSRFVKYHYCNLTGALLLVPNIEGKNKDCLDIAKITLRYDYLLKVEIVRHRTKISILKELKNTTDNQRKKELNTALYNKPHYIFEPSTSSLRRHLERDGESDAKLTYIASGLKGKKASTPFLDFASIDDFNKSRAGIFDSVITSIKEHLSEYMDVNFSPRKIDEEIPLKRTLMKQPKQLHSLLNEQKINIVDRVNSEDSASLVTTLKKLIFPYMTDQKLITDEKTDKKNALNFRIIHNESYYSKNGLDDEYIASDENTQRQNLTIESTASLNQAIVKTSIKELLIKRDISSGKLNLFNWAELQCKGVWTFAAWDEDKSHVIFMEIQPNGDFEFHRVKDLFNWKKFEQYQNFMTDDNNSKKLRTLEGLVVSDVGDINQIFRTEEITIPDLDKIRTIIEEVEMLFPENKRNGDALAEIIQGFMEERVIENRDKLVKFHEELKKLGDSEIDKNSFKKILNEQLGKQSTIASELRDYFLTKHQIRLHFPKDKHSLDDIFAASLNINYFGETATEAYYFVGNRKENVQSSFKDSCHLRKIVAVDGSELIFRQLLTTMDVDFVRTGQSTVIPFPFKYIEEYKKIIQVK